MKSHRIIYLSACLNTTPFLRLSTPFIRLSNYIHAVTTTVFGLEKTSSVRGILERRNMCPSVLPQTGQILRYRLQATVAYNKNSGTRDQTAWICRMIWVLSVYITSKTQFIMMII